MQNNFINLDYLGHLSKSKEYAVQQLFERNLLASPALMFITLENSGLAQARAVEQGYLAQQDQSIKK